MTAFRRLAAAFVASSSFAAAEARAEDLGDLEGLLDERVVQAASKSLETTSSAPATSTVITAEDLRRYGMRTLDEAINFLAMGVVVENSLHNLKIGVRGVHFGSDYGNHVLLLVNGHAMNEPWGGTAYYERGTGIPFELIDRIEVILGPGSVLYGSNAMLAVINVVTKRAKDWNGVHAAVESEIPISLRGLAGFGREFKLFGKKAEATAAVEYFAQDGPAFRVARQHTGPGTRYVVGGPKDGIWGGLADRSNYTQLPDGYLRILVGDFEINARAAYWKRSVSFATLTFDDPNSYEVERWLSSDIRHKAVLSKSVDLVSRLYADSYDYQEFYNTADASGCVGGMPRGCLYYDVGTSRWVGLEEQLSMDWTHDGAFVTLLGVDGRLRRVGLKTDYIELETGRNPGSYGQYTLEEYVLGAYAQQVLRPVKSFEVNAGVRVDIEDAFGAQASPRMAVAVKPWDGATLKGIYSQAFRAPGPYERFYVDPTYHVAAPNLGPESVRSVELTAEQTVKSQRVLVGVFRSWWEDMVGERDLSPDEVAAARARKDLDPTITEATQYRNLARIESYGFNAALEGALFSGRLRYGFTMTSAFARVRPTPHTKPEQLPVSPSLSGNGRISVDLGGALPVLGVAGRFIGARPADEFGGGYTPEPYAPSTEEIRATLSGKVPLVPHLTYRGTVSYVVNPVAPFLIGPGSRAHLQPVDELRTGFGLNYDMPL